MPLMYCPDCRRKVSCEAVACPNCGRPIKGNIPAEKPGSLDAVVGGLIILGLAIWGGYKLFWSDDGGGNRTSSQTSSVTAAPTSLPTVRVKYEQIDEWTPSTVLARFVVKTEATNEQDFWEIINLYKAKIGKSYLDYGIDFFPMDAPNPGSIARYVRGEGEEDAWDENQIAQYSLNRSTGEKLEIFRATPKPLPIDGVEAVELYPSQVLNLKSVVVRVDSAAQPVLSEVAAYYEQAYGRPDGLTIYFTTTDAKWAKYPRVYPASVPKEIVMVYSRYKDKTQLVEGAKFK